MNILLTICARSGSVSVPDKNIKPIAGIPLIGYAIKLAKQIAAEYDADIAVSTDSEKYLQIANSFGVYSNYIRPEYLASSQAGKIDVFKDVLIYYETQKNKKYDFLCDLEVTSPLRNLEDFSNAYEKILRNKDALVVYGATLSVKNPYYNLVEIDSDGYSHLCIPPKNEVLTRQSAPKVYESNGMLYLFRREFFDMTYKTFFTDRTMIYESPHLTVDIDNPIDFEFIDYLISNNKLDFNLF